MNSYPYSVYFDGLAVTVNAYSRSKARYEGYLKMKKDFGIEDTFARFIKESIVSKHTQHVDYGSDSFNRSEYYDNNRPWKTRGCLY